MSVHCKDGRTEQNCIRIFSNLKEPTVRGRRPLRSPCSIHSLVLKAPANRQGVPMSLHRDQGFERTLNQCGLVRSQWQY